MKVQLKIDQKAIQDFLLQHVEKIGLGIVVAIFLLMLYSALNSAARFDRTPDQLRTQTAAGRREIDATPAATGLTVENYSAEAQRSRVQIAAKPYANPTPWDPPLFERRPLRDVPPLLGVQQLRGAAGMGAFHASAEASTDAKAAPDAAAALPPARRPAAGRKPRDAAPMDMLMGEIMPMQAMRGGENAGAASPGWSPSNSKRPPSSKPSEGRSSTIRKRTFPTI